MSVEVDAARSMSGRVRSFLRLPRRARSLKLSRALRRPPLLAHLVLFALIVLVPALLFSAFLILQFTEQQREIATAQVNDTAEIISNAVDREVYGMITTGRVLASSPSLVDGSLATFHDRTVAALRATDTSAALVDQNLDVIMSTLEPFPAPPQKAATTESIEEVFRTRQPKVSGVFYGPRTRAFLFHVAVPVLKDGAVSYVLVISKAADNLSAVIADRNLPREWSAVITDARGQRVFAATASGGRMRSHRDGSAEGRSSAETLDAIETGELIEATTTSTLSGWSTTLTVPNLVIVRPVLRSWFLLVGVGLLLFLFSILLGVVFGRRIATPIMQLSKQAERIGRNEPAITFSTDIAEIGEVSKVLAQASRDRREAEEQNRFLMREMTHRAKNQYALIAAIARRAAKESVDTTQFLATLSEALNSLARSADLLAGRGWESVPLADLVASQLKAFGAGGEQIEMAGPEVVLNPTAAQTIGLALHELATNAAKYGSLSNGDGVVAITWSIGERFEIVWRESGGPPVVEPRHVGFGTLVTQKMTSRGLGGEVEMVYAPTGVVWKLSAPNEAVVLRS